MAIPDYQTLMLPLLKILSNGEELHFRPLVEVLSDAFGLSDVERKHLLPSGAMTTISSRAGWARTYLKKAGLIEQPKRGYVKITSRGLSVLEKNLQKIDVKLLEQFPEFIEFRDAGKTEVETQTISTVSDTTPEESIENAFVKLNSQLSADLLEIIKSSSPSFFERLVVALLLAMGYGGSRIEAGRAIGQSGDGGIDGIIDEDKLGLDSIYIQAKRWEGTVGRPEIQKFVGALQGNRAHKGVFITTSDFTKEAQEYVKNINNKVVLINGFTLARFMIENDVGVSTVSTYKVKKIDSDYFVDE
ncbi:MAG TPA: restriction endonuclease [Methylotenera sp.]|nr:restriction endonuclease [Methylotenera sp.]